MAKVIIFDYDGVANTRKGAETIDRWLAGGDIIHIAPLVADVPGPKSNG